MENQESTQAENNSSTAVLDNSENNIEIPFPKRDVSLTVNEVDLKVLKGQKK